MNIKKDLVSWYFKNIIVPKFVKYEEPGFVVTLQNARGESVFQRDIFFSETQLANFESKIVEKFGEEGKKILYKIGKDFGFAFAHSFSVPQIKTDGKKSVEEFIPIFTDFIGATWGKSSKYSYNLKDEMIEWTLHDFVICRKNKLGYMLTAGVMGGGWQSMMENENIEVVQTKCSEKECHVICAPKKFLKENKIKFIEYIASSIVEPDENYFEMNKIRKINYSSASMNEMITNQVFDFGDSKISFHGERYFPVGIEFLYFIEKHCKEKKELEKILFETSFEQGKTIAEQEKDNEYSMFIPDLLSAFGYGDTIINEDKGKIIVAGDYFPWTPLYDKINFSYYRGLLSGMLSTYLNKKINLTKFQTDVSGGYLRLEISE